MIDLTGLELDPALSTAGLADDPVKGVRVSRFDHNTVRVVFDLEYLVGYKLERRTEAPGGLRLDFNVVFKGHRLSTGQCGARDLCRHFRTGAV